MIDANLVRPFARMFAGAILTLGSFTGAAFADNINLDMQGTTATVPKGNTVERQIYNMPAGLPGTLKLKLKWHAVNVVPTFNLMKVQLKHGSTVLQTANCYSIHSNKSPKCDMSINISQAEANKSGKWTLVVTNNSGFETIGFNIEKGSDLNPMVPNFKSYYTPNCPSTVNLDMEGTTLTLTKGGTQERKLYGIGQAAGVLTMRAKWHAVSVVPNTFNPLKIELLKPNGSVALTGNYYSFHSNKSGKYNLTYNISASDAAQSGNWKLRITNNSDFDVIGFNIEKESGEINPLVPFFFSSYLANCN